MEPQDRTTERSTPAVHGAVSNRRYTMRVIRDRKRGMVLVYEAEPATSDPGPRTLVFEASRFTTRLERYPVDWRHMPDADLLALAVRE